MALGLYFQPTGFSPAAYDEVVEELEKAGWGFGSVPGRTFHCAIEVAGSIAIFDVWESIEQFEELGETLIPIMNKLGLEPGLPRVSTVHNLRNE